MKYLEEFRDPRLARALAKSIARHAAGLGSVKLMEVCGSHTMAIARYGIRKLLPQSINHRRSLSNPQINIQFQ